MTEPDQYTGDGTTNREGNGVIAATRRSVLRAAGVGASGLAFGGAVTGSGAAQSASLPWLERDGNKIRDQRDNEVWLRGATMADPGRMRKAFRAKSATDVVELAANGEREWDLNVLRIPTQPAEIAADWPDPPPHGDPLGPLLPGQFEDDDLERYFSEVVDPVVDACEEHGLYAIVDYHREAAVFYQTLDDYRRRSDGPCAGRESGDRCGERGVLWHSEAQADELDGWTDPYAAELDAEIRRYWSFVADRYADRSHVLFELMSSPTGPYNGLWGDPSGRPIAGEPYGYGRGAERSHSTRRGARRYWDMWLDRAQPWVETVRRHAPNNLLLIGSPGWCQYTNWAAETEFDGCNLAYTGQAYAQDVLHPLDEHFGVPAESVPVVMTEFGWQENATARYFEETTTTIGESFQDLFADYPVHGVAAWFDPYWQPSFFDVAADGADAEWQRKAYDASPATMWSEVTWDVREERRSEPGDGTPGCPQVGVGDLPPVGDADPPTDPDGDGYFEDVNGNGEADFGDVETLFEHLDDPALADNPAHYDFNGNEELDFGDVVALFESL